MYTNHNVSVFYLLMQMICTVDINIIIVKIKIDFLILDMLSMHCIYNKQMFYTTTYT